MSQSSPSDPSPVAAAGRAGVEAWLAALDAGREWNRIATTELLALVGPPARQHASTARFAESVAAAADTADTLAQVQQTLLYATGATVFGMQPRATDGEPIRLEIDD